MLSMADGMTIGGTVCGHIKVKVMGCLLIIISNIHQCMFYRTSLMVKLGLSPLI